MSLFFLKLRKEDDSLNNMEIVRLKDKMGTRQLPTAEMLLKGAYAHLVSEKEQGVKGLSKMLAITRIYNAGTAVGLMRRGIALARDYACRRKIGKIQLADMPLQQRVLSRLEVIHRGNLMMYLRVAEIFSKEQASTINDHEANIVRVMTPLAKMFTGKEVLVVLNEAIEAFGGMGYIESSMIPVLVRDAQVLAIWEGTTNVMSYDFVRALMKKENKYWPLESLTHYFEQLFEKVRESKRREQVVEEFGKIKKAYDEIFGDIRNAMKIKFKGCFGDLRNYCFGVSRIFIASELLNHYLKTGRKKDLEVARRWVEFGLYHPDNFDKSMDKDLAMNLDQSGNCQGVGNFDKRGVPRPRI